MTDAKIIADSVNSAGDRVTSMQVEIHRYMLPEWNTHGVFATNSASSRARPIRKVIEDVLSRPAYPTTWRKEQSGMQGGDSLTEREIAYAKRRWDKALQFAVATADDLRELGLHKGTTNRLIEPYAQHVIVVTSTSFGNFFQQRISDQAQDDIRAAAEAMRDAYEASIPTLLQPGEWHTPYIDAETTAMLLDLEGEYNVLAAKVSAARAARVSYLTQEGVRDIAKDLELYERLTTAKPPHWSPLEHVATPWLENRQTEDLSFTGFDGETLTVPTGHLPRVGKFVGWRPLRTQVEAAQGAITWH